jgi:hypothetical protein
VRCYLVWRYGVQVRVLCSRVRLFHVGGAQLWIYLLGWNPGGRLLGCLEWDFMWVSHVLMFRSSYLSETGHKLVDLLLGGLAYVAALSLIVRFMVRGEEGPGD